MSVRRSTGNSYAAAADTLLLLSHCNRTSPFVLSNKQVLKGLFYGTGFKEVSLESMLLSINLNSPWEFAEKSLELSAPLNQKLIGLNRVISNA